MNQSIKEGIRENHIAWYRYIRENHIAWDRYKRNKSSTNWANNKQKRNAATNLVKNAKSVFENKLAEDIKTNPRQTHFWKYVQDKAKTSSNISALENDAGELIDDDTGKAKTLNNYFASVFTTEDTHNLPDMELSNNEANKIENVIVSKNKISVLLDNLDISKSAGPDGISPKVLKECKSVMATILNITFQKSLQEGILPSQWKEATVKPLFKKGNKKLATNYRPVSLTSTCKLFEKIIRETIFGHLEQNKLIVNEQYGFVRDRSCNTQLLDITECWTKWLDEEISWDCIYLDFAKAFDRVPHQRLLLKIEHYGITGKLLNWITDFLKDRKQKAVTGNTNSVWKEVKSGIPQ